MTRMCLSGRWAAADLSGHSAMLRYSNHVIGIFSDKWAGVSLRKHQPYYNPRGPRTHFDWPISLIAFHQTPCCVAWCALCGRNDYGKPHLCDRCSTTSLAALMFGKSSNRRDNKEQTGRPFRKFWKFWKSAEETVDEPSDTADGPNNESVGPEAPFRVTDLHPLVKAEWEACVHTFLSDTQRNWVNIAQSYSAQEIQGGSRGRGHRTGRRGGIRRCSACRAQQTVECQKKRDALELVGACVEVVKVTETKCIGPRGHVMDLSLGVLTQLERVTGNFKSVLPQIRIQKVEYVLNERLYTLFNETKAEFRLHGKSTEEMLLYHGTNADNVDR